MSDNESAVYAVLDQLGISYERFRHAPVYTVEDVDATGIAFGGFHCKNLFVRNQKGDRHYLVIVPAQRPVDLRHIAEVLGSGKLSFASPERLKRYLGLEPGAVGPFGLINDAQKAVEVLVDPEVATAPRLTFHPNVNTASVTIAQADFRRFLEHCGHRMKVG